MKRIQFFAILSALFLVWTCTKESDFAGGDIEIRAVIGSDDTRVCYSDGSEGGNVTLKQEWQVGDKLIGYCSGERFCYEVKSLSGSAAFLKWSDGYKLTGTETGVSMYYAPGCLYTDITSEGLLPVDISCQYADGKMPATLSSCGDFVDGSLNLVFSNRAAVLRIDRLCWLPADSKVSEVKVYGAVSSASLSGTSWSGGSSSVITLTKEGGWDTDALGEMNDTLRIALLPSSSSASIAVKAVVGGNEYTVYRAPVTVTAGKYYYNSPIGARMVSGGDISYYTDVEQAVAAANASSSDAFITMLADHTIAGDSLKFLNASGRKISLDLGNSVLTGRSAIWSEVEFTASGSGYAQNNSNVVVVRSSGKFTMRGSSLVSTATAAANTSSPLCLYSESGTQFGEAAIDGTTVIGYSTYGAVYIFGCALTVSGEADFSAPRPLFVSTNGSLTVNGGTFNATSFTSQCIHIGASTSAVTINSGVFNANSRLFNFNSEKASAAKVVVTGGRFSWNGDFSGTWSGTNVAISGGLFSKEVPYGLATGYSCVTNPDPETAMEYPYTVLHD